MWATNGRPSFFATCCGLAVLLLAVTLCICIAADVAGKWKPNPPPLLSAPSWREPTMEEFREICRAFLDSPAHRKHLQEALDRGLKCRCEVRPDVGAGIACYLPNQGTTI